MLKSETSRWLCSTKNHNPRHEISIFIFTAAGKTIFGVKIECPQLWCGQCRTHERLNMSRTKVMRNLAITTKSIEIVRPPLIIKNQQ